MVITITDSFENEGIPEENQKLYRAWYDSGNGHSVMSSWCEELLDTTDGHTVEKFVFNGNTFAKTADKAIEFVRRFEIVSKMNAVSLSFSYKEKIDLSEYNRKLEKLRVWCKNDTAIFYNLEENPEQKEDFICRLVINYTLMKISEDTKLSTMHFSVRAFNRLTSLHVTDLRELTALTSLEYPDVICCFGGHKAEDEILWALGKLGLKLGMNKWI